MKTAQQEFIESAQRFVIELKEEGISGLGIETLLDDQIESIIFSIMYKNGASTRRVNKLKKVCNSVGSH